MTNSDRTAKISSYVTVALATLPAAAGSVVTFIYVAVALLGIASLAQRRFSGKLCLYDKIIIYPSLAFFLVNTFSLVRYDFQLKDLESIVPSLLFLLPFFVIKQFRFTTNENQFSIFLKTVPYGAFLLLPWILYEGLYLGQRMSAGAGNPIPLGMICALMLPICLMNMNSFANKKQFLIIAFGFIVFLSGLILSGSRSMYLAAIPNLIIAASYLVYRSKNKFNISAILLLLLFSIAVFAWNSTIVKERTTRLATSITSILNGSEFAEASTQYRYSMLKKGICYAQNSIIIGYGISNRREILTSDESIDNKYFSFCAQNQDVFYYSHFHNGFLTTFIDAGIFGLISTLVLLFAPITLAMLSPPGGLKSLRICVALCLTSVYFSAGLTNLLFGHDLIDAIFLIFASFLSLSISEKKQVYQHS